MIADWREGLPCFCVNNVLSSDVMQKRFFRQGGLGETAGASRRLARYKPVVEVATRPTPPEPNLKSTASRRDARGV
jgi:hypothetical protein